MEKNLVCNSGYFQDFKHQLNRLSKSSATHSTLSLNDTSSCKFTKDTDSSLKNFPRFKSNQKKYCL